jgi:hypothetical protein
MSSNFNSPSNVPRTRPATWAGRVLAVLAALALVGSAGLKLADGPAVDEMTAHLGIPTALAHALPFLELTCLAFYVIPRTAPLGAVLLTGYCGGAVFAHLRVGDPFVAPVAIGVLVWAGLALRDARLAAYLWQTVAGR